MDEIEGLVRSLQEQIPHVEVTSDPDELHNYTVDGVMPRLVVTPATSEEAAQIVTLTNQHNLTLLPRGNGTHLNLGGIPERIDLLVETRKLDKLLEYEAPDLTCRVEAGMTLAKLQETLAKKGQRLALDPAGAEQATIGGLLAANASGPKRLRYGTARDLVIGLRVIQANGEIARSGGNVVKNVAGYDLNKLYIGSLGTLGLIVEANFKLHPLVEEHTLLFTYTSAEEAMQTTMAITGSLLTPSAIELIDAGAASDMSDFFGLNLPTNGYTLALSFEDRSNTTIGRQVDEARLIARKHNALLGDELEGEEQQRFWQVVREHTQGTLTCKVAILVSQVATYLRHVERLCQRHNLEAAVVAHAGNGILYVELRPADASPRLLEAISALRRHAQEARGSLVIERCPVELKRRIDIWGEPGSDFRLMQRLKQQLDPKGIFVKGRFLGGL